MKLWRLLSAHTRSAILITLGSTAAIYLVLRLFVFSSDPVYPLLSYVEKGYLSLFEAFADTILRLTASGVSIKNSIVTSGGVAVTGFIPVIKLKRWLVVFLIVIWITRASWKSKTGFTLLLLTVHFIMISTSIAIGALLARAGADIEASMSIPYTVTLITLVTIVFKWLKINIKEYRDMLHHFEINPSFLDKLSQSYVIALLVIITSSFLFVFFEYRLWIDILFHASQKILALLGYEATVEPFHLTGQRGSIFMGKACLGFQTMLLFVLMIALTGKNSKSKMFYTVAGLLLLNIVNILRFVFLFIHIENHGGYLLAVEVHDRYNYLVYALVFILWVIWYEFFSSGKAKEGA